MGASLCGLQCSSSSILTASSTSSLTSTSTSTLSTCCVPAGAGSFMHSVHIAIKMISSTITTNMFLCARGAFFVIPDSTIHHSDVGDKEKIGSAAEATSGRLDKNPPLPCSEACLSKFMHSVRIAFKTISLTYLIMISWSTCDPLVRKDTNACLRSTLPCCQKYIIIIFSSLGATCASPCLQLTLHCHRHDLAHTHIDFVSLRSERVFSHFRSAIQTIYTRMNRFFFGAT